MKLIASLTRGNVKYRMIFKDGLYRVQFLNPKTKRWCIVPDKDFDFISELLTEKAGDFFN